MKQDLSKGKALPQAVFLVDEHEAFHCQAQWCCQGGTDKGQKVGENGNSLGDHKGNSDVQEYASAGCERDYEPRLTTTQCSAS